LKLDLTLALFYSRLARVSEPPDWFIHRPRHLWGFPLLLRFSSSYALLLFPLRNHVRVLFLFHQPRSYSFRFSFRRKFLGSPLGFDRLFLSLSCRPFGPHKESFPSPPVGRRTSLSPSSFLLPMPLPLSFAFPFLFPPPPPSPPSPPSSPSLVPPACVEFPTYPPPRDCSRVTFSPPPLLCYSFWPPFLNTNVFFFPFPSFPLPFCSCLQRGILIYQKKVVCEFFSELDPSLFLERIILIRLLLFLTRTDLVSSSLSPPLSGSKT